MSKINGINNIQTTDYETGIKKAGQTGGESFDTYLNKTTNLDEIFEKASQKYNVPVKLLKAIAKAESDFNPNAVSKAGAQGIMQLMPGTAKELGVTDPFDPEQNIMGGSKYISDLLKRYNGDVKLALAAYNAGMNNVKKYGGVPPFKETQNYVVKVMKYMEEDFTAGTVKSSGISKYNGLAAKTVAGTAGVNQAPDWVISPAFPNGKISMDSIADVMDLLFSYQDYLNFIDIFLNDNNSDNNNRYNFF